jgi:seryl-tRNA synthetase
MHDIELIRENPDAFDTALKRRGLPPMSATLLEMDRRRRTAIQAFETTRAQSNTVSKAIGVAKLAKDEARAAALLAEAAEFRKTLPQLEALAKTVAKEVDADLRKALAEIPNLPLDDVPDGADEHGNVQRHVFGKLRNYAFNPKPHDDLGGALRQMDFATAARLSGARFVVLKKGLARLERAIGQFMLDLHTNEHGYTEINPPLLVRNDVMFGTGQLPKFADDQFFNTRLSEFETLQVMKLPARQKKLAAVRKRKQEILEKLEAGLPKTKLSYWKRELIAKTVQERRLQEEIWEVRPQEGHWLIPTAEVPLTNLVRESILDEKELPLRFTALTPCFRAEAGAAGRDTRGMIRQHQFTKVELVSITTPENSKDEHERMLSSAEEVLRRLDLHYRVMTLCAGDMGFSAQKTYDIEVWMPGQGEGGAYREISSCSVCGDFQARRMDARYRGPDGKPRFVHTLNGSGTAVGRALIAVMETYQQEDGSIAVPDVLQPYMGGVKVVERDK